MSSAMCGNRLVAVSGICSFKIILMKASNDDNKMLSISQKTCEELVKKQGHFSNGKL